MPLFLGRGRDSRAGDDSDDGARRARNAAFLLPRTPLLRPPQPRPLSGRALGAPGVGARDRLDAQEAVEPLHAPYRHGRRFPEGLPRCRALSARGRTASRGQATVVLRIPRRAAPPHTALCRRARADPSRGHGHDDPLVQLHAEGVPRGGEPLVLPPVGRRLRGRSLQCRVGYPRRPQSGQLLETHADAYRRIRLSADVPYDRHCRARGVRGPFGQSGDEALRLPPHPCETPRTLSHGARADRLVGLLPARMEGGGDRPAPFAARSRADDHPGLHLRSAVEPEQHRLHELGRGGPLPLYVRHFPCLRVGERHPRLLRPDRRTAARRGVRPHVQGLRLLARDLAQRSARYGILHPQCLVARRDAPRGAASGVLPRPLRPP